MYKQAIADDTVPGRDPDLFNIFRDTAELRELSYNHKQIEKADSAIPRLIRKSGSLVPGEGVRDLFVIRIGKRSR